MADRLTVLVTGTGAPLGVSIFKAFRSSALAPRIVATDADPLSVGLFRADAGHVLPRIDHGIEPYLQRLTDICRREQVQLVCLGSELEMEYLARHIEAFERSAGAKLVLNSPGVLAPFMDKLEMVRVLRDKDLPVPETVPANDPDSVRAFMARHAFPVIFKPRHGAGSKNMFVVRDADHLTFLSRYLPEAVLQEYLFPDDEEYTVGVYRSRRAGHVGQIVLKRRLGAGLTYKAEVVFDPDIDSVCRRLVESLDLWGPVNVQLRKTAHGVRIFEVNPRFSSSAVMRAHFGFNEAELCLRDLVLEETIPTPKIRPGVALRYWDEVYVERDEYARLVQYGEIVEPRSAKVDNF